MYIVYQNRIAIFLNKNTHSTYSHTHILSHTGGMKSDPSSLWCILYQKGSHFFLVCNEVDNDVNAALIK